MSSTNAQPEENKMGIMPIPKLLLSMALPMMASMLVQALYNVVDSIFVARLSEDALTAVSLAFPMQNLMIATGAGVGVGMNAMLSKKLGEKDFEGANRAASNGVFLSILMYILFLIIGIFVTRTFCFAIAIMIIGLLILQFFPDKLLGLFDVSDNMIAIGVPALKTISVSFVFAGFCIVSSSVFQAFGNGILSMLVSFARQLLVLLPVACFFSRTGNLNLVWLSYPIAEIMSLILCSLFLRRTYVKVIKPL